MSMRKFLPLSSLLLVCTLLSTPAYSQQDDSSSQSQDNSTVEGTVVASSRTSFVVKSDNNRFQVFTFDRDTNKPPSLAVGSQVRVESDQADDTGARHPALRLQPRGEHRIDDVAERPADDVRWREASEA